MIFGTETTITLETCTCIQCGITFGMPHTFRQRRLEDHKNFFCPNGHSQFYSGKSEAERLKDELARKTAWLDQSREHGRALERRLSATQGVVTRIKNRVSKGVCPCCNRHFANVERHMKTKHPDYSQVED